MTNFILKIILLCLDLIRWVLVIMILITIFGMIQPYLSDANSYTYLRKVTHFENSMNIIVKDHIPTKIAGYDCSRVISLIILMILLGIRTSLENKAGSFILHKKMRQEFDQIKKTYQSPEQQKIIAVLENKIEQSSLLSGKNRHELLKDFAQIKKELEKIGRDLAFLSIDVVNSTSMKDNEDTQTVESDFVEYHNYVEAKFKEHGLIKASWTPDGVMACFNTIEDAIQAACVQRSDYFTKCV